MKHTGFVRTLTVTMAMLGLASGSVALAEQNQAGGPASAPTHTVPAKPQRDADRTKIMKDGNGGTVITSIGTSDRAQTDNLTIKTKSSPAAVPSSSPIEERKASPAAVKPTCPPGWQLYGVGNPVKEWKCRPKNTDPR